MDTLKAVHELERAGLSRAQAEAIAMITRSMHPTSNKEVVTRSYLDNRLAKHTLLIIAIFAMFVVLQSTRKNPRESALAASSAAPTISVKPNGEPK